MRGCAAAEALLTISGVSVVVLTVLAAVKFRIAVSPALLSDALIKPSCVAERIELAFTLQRWYVFCRGRPAFFRYETLFA